MNIYAMLILVVIINITLFYLIIRWYKNKLSTEYQNFLNKTDEILSGKKIDLSYDESLDSAISERLNRIMEIACMQKETAEEERDIIKSLITNINHQIKTPLANITLYTGLIKEQISDEKTTRLANKIENNADKLNFFMKQLLKSSYAEQELISVSPKIVDLDTVMKKSCQSIELDAMKKEIQIISEYHNCKIYADLKWTEEVFTNILENAIKYSPSGASVIVKSTLYESFVCVQIIDSGIGIPEQEQGKIFQRFYRGSNVTDKQGFGIGLYLAREVLRKQQGYIKVKSTMNRGTTIEVFLLREDL